MPSSSRYPKKLRDSELPVQAFRDMKTTRDELDDFKVILTAQDRVVTPFGNAISREMSTSWRGQARAAALYRINVLEYLQTLTEGVQLVDKSDLTLSGRSATIPVTVQNKLLQDVHLVLRLTSDNKHRLKLNGDGVAELPVKISGGHSQSVKFTASANVNGQVPMTAQLYTEDGTPYGQPMTFTVKVSEITATVMLVIMRRRPAPRPGRCADVQPAQARGSTQRRGRGGRRAGGDGPRTGGGRGGGHGAGGRGGPLGGTRRGRTRAAE